MGTKSREAIYGASVRHSAEQAAEARRVAFRGITAPTRPRPREPDLTVPKKPPKTRAQKPITALFGISKNACSETIDLPTSLPSLEPGGASLRAPSEKGK